LSSALTAACTRLSSSALDTEALDDLVNLMLGKPNQFLLCASLRGFGR